MKVKNMKPLLLALLLASLSQMIGISPVNGQIPVTLEVIPNDKGIDRQVYTVTIPLAELKKTERNWGDYLEENAFGWESVKKGVHRQSGILEKTISARRFSIYNEMVMTESGVRLTIWFEQQRRPLTAEKTGDRLDVALKGYIHKFAIGQYSTAIQSRLKDQQRAKQKLELQQASLNRGQSKPKQELSEEDYRTQTAAISQSIVAQNLKMQGLLDMMNRIQRSGINK
jgi:hypothetical protein